MVENLQLRNDEIKWSLITMSLNNILFGPNFTVKNENS